MGYTETTCSLLPLKRVPCAAEEQSQLDTSGGVTGTLGRQGRKEKGRGCISHDVAAAIRVWNLLELC